MHRVDERKNTWSKPLWMTHMPVFDWLLSESFWSDDFEKYMTAKELHEILSTETFTIEGILYTPDEYFKFVEEIRENGLLTPVTFSNTDINGTQRDTMSLRDGHHRLSAFYALGQKYIPHILRG